MSDKIVLDDCRTYAAIWGAKINVQTVGKE